MKATIFIYLGLVIAVFSSCSSESKLAETPPTATYFPPKTGTEWQTQSMESLG